MIKAKLQPLVLEVSAIHSSFHLGTHRYRHMEFPHWTTSSKVAPVFACTFFYTPCLMCIAASLLLKPCCTMRTGPYLEHYIVSWSSEFANVFVRRQ
ncbi:hypothetical protein GQ55_9G054800 [Panicum hallii var. hallii]|uniref:Uncharacterized protein n=1 Tax=Panicum hallii var. hallii TaxID=1504633 RepID=A0A2T7BZZ5_9POAL|nr:hypothetical protein GQ55_9G054800 [Panicum hallii var. hallii]